MQSTDQNTKPMEIVEQEQPVSNIKRDVLLPTSDKPEMTPLFTMQQIKHSKKPCPKCGYESLYVNQHLIAEKLGEPKVVGGEHFYRMCDSGYGTKAYCKRCKDLFIPLFKQDCVLFYDKQYYENVVCKECTKLGLPEHVSKKILDETYAKSYDPKTQKSRKYHQMCLATIHGV